mgnify:CR=1 FL=1
MYKVLLVIGMWCFAHHSGFGQSALLTGSNDSTLNYRTRNTLVIVRVVINDTMKVSLALDVHCRSVVLFGKKLGRQLEASRSLAGIGESKHESLSHNNKISIGPIEKDDVSILVVPNYNPVNFFTNVNGMISTSFFSDYSLMLDHKKQIMVLNPEKGQVPPLVEHPSGPLSF